MASYKDAVDWIARNDDPATLDVDDVSRYLTTHLVADLWGKDSEEVGRAIVRLRKRIEREEG